VKKNNLLQGTIVALLVASPFAAFAGEYPAADFEPKVLYQDESIKSSAPAAKAAPAAAPVATASVSSDDSQYPATNFQPKVLFQDENYKPSKSAPSIAPTSAPEFTTSAGAVVMEASKKEEGMDPNLFILAGLAAAAFGVSRCPKFAGIFGGNTASNEPSASTETGVTRYLNCAYS